MAKIGQKTARLPPEYEWLWFLLWWTVILPLFVIIMPFALIDCWHREHRLRRWYQSVNRFLQWDRAGQMLPPGKGTLIIEVVRLEGLGHIWWVESDIRTQYPAIPICPTNVLDPSADIEHRFRVLADENAKAWWQSHRRELGESVFLVQMPSIFRRQREKLMAIPNAIAVDDSWTLAWAYPWEDL